MPQHSQVHNNEIANALQDDVSSPHTDRLARVMYFSGGWLLCCNVVGLLFQTPKTEYGARGSMIYLVPHTLSHTCVNIALTHDKFLIAAIKDTKIYN